MKESHRGASCPDLVTLDAFAEGRLPADGAAQVQAHAETCSQCADQLDRSDERATAVLGPPAGVSAEGAPNGNESATPDAPLNRGESLGRYIILDRVGEGGMGVVYAAYDPELNRKVAIKLLQTGARGSQSTGGRERLIREAQALARLSHPNVVHVHDVGTHGDRVFMAMELVEGRSLRDWLREKPRSWREVTATFVAAGRGLSAAHAAGLVHRDCKPDNLHIGLDGRVRVLDFGIARLASDDAEPVGHVAPRSERVSLATPLTEVGTVLGTPSYLPPEVLDGRAADPRSDQFSFCVSLYEALYGRRPFPGNLPRNDPQRWTLREPSGDRKVPVWLRRVVLRGLSLSPEQRHPTMDALLAELGKDPRAKQRQWLMSAAIAGLIAAVSGGAYLQSRSQPVPCHGVEQGVERIWNASTKQALESAFLATGKGFAAEAWSNTERPLDAYATAWVAMRQDACAATRIRGEQSDEVLSLRMACLDRRLESFHALTQLLAKADGDLVQQATRAANALPGLDLCADVEALRAPVPPPEGREAQARVNALRKQLAEGQALFDAGRYQPGLELAKSAVESARALAYRPLEAEALELLAGFQMRTGDLKAAEETLYEAIWAAEAGRHDLVVGSASAKVVSVATYQARSEVGQHWAEHARAALERVGGDARTEANLLNALAAMAFRSGGAEAALEHFEKSLALRLKVYGPDHPEVAAIHNNIGMVLANGRPREALPHLEKSLAIFERALGREHPDTTKALTNLGSIAVELAELDKSIEYNRRALAAAEKGLGPDHPTVGAANQGIGEALTNQGRYEEAIAHLRRALSIYEAVYGPEHVSLLSSLRSLGVALEGTGDSKGALQTIERATQIAQRAHPPEHPDMAVAWRHLADAELAQGRTNESRIHFERSVEIAKKALGPEHRELALAYIGLGSWHLHKEQFREALTLLEKARDIQDKSLGDHPHVSRTLTLMGRARLGLGDRERAIPELERALTLAQKEGAPPGTLEEARFTLARALWGLGEDRARAVELATRARDGYARQHHHQKDLAKVQAWLARTTRP
ncbi:MAG: serine/threonine-protein kinase [Myxococcaceae bacterium]